MNFNILIKLNGVELKMVKKKELEKKLCSLACEYYDSYGCFEMDLWTDENNECHVKIDREWVNGQ